jgi:hypothetical protein
MLSVIRKRSVLSPSPICVADSELLNPVIETGNFGNAGRNIARGNGIFGLDLSLLKNFALSDKLRVQFRAECFNLPNHTNFGLPVTDLASPSFGRILEAAPPRLVQLGLKFLF